MTHSRWKRDDPMTPRKRVRLASEVRASSDLGEVIGPRESAVIVNIDDGSMSMLMADSGDEREMLPAEALLGAILILARDEDWVEATLALAGLEKKN